MKTRLCLCSWDKPSSRREVTCWTVPFCTAAEPEGHPHPSGRQPPPSTPREQLAKPSREVGFGWAHSGHLHGPCPPSALVCHPPAGTVWHSCSEPARSHLVVHAPRRPPSLTLLKGESPTPPSRTPALASPWKRPPWPPSRSCFLGTPVETPGRVPSSSRAQYVPDLPFASLLSFKIILLQTCSYK